MRRGMSRRRRSRSSSSVGVVGVALLDEHGAGEAFVDVLVDTRGVLRLQAVAADGAHRRIQQRSLSRQAGRGCIFGIFCSSSLGGATGIGPCCTGRRGCWCRRSRLVFPDAQVLWRSRGGLGWREQGRSIDGHVDGCLVLTRRGRTSSLGAFSCRTKRHESLFLLFSNLQSFLLLTFLILFFHVYHYMIDLRRGWSGRGQALPLSR